MAHEYKVGDRVEASWDGKVWLPGQEVGWVVSKLGDSPRKGVRLDDNGTIVCPNYIRPYTPPQTRRVPLGAGELLGKWVSQDPRRIGWCGGLEGDDLRIVGGGYFTPQHAMEQRWEWSDSPAGPWRPCWKEEVVNGASVTRDILVTHIMPEAMSRQQFIDAAVLAMIGNPHAYQTMTPAEMWADAEIQADARERQMKGASNG